MAVYKFDLEKQLKKSKDKKLITVYKFYSGLDPEKIQKAITDDTRIWKYQNVELIQLIDFKNELLTLNAQTQKTVAVKIVN